jgi:two-component system, chemotaxis family, protein-glutamate methylesterase/glutaminase
LSPAQQDGGLDAGYILERETGMNRRIKVLIVDDSAFMRQQLSAALSQDPRIEIVGVARDGEEAVAKAVEMKPDVITMDILMPKMDGLTSLQYILELAPCPIIIVSSYTYKGALITFEALELGAFDFVPKPEGAGKWQSTVANLVDRIVAAAASESSRRQRGSQWEQAVEQPQPREEIQEEAGFDKVVVIGVSTGGPKTLMEILPHLPKDFPAPVLLVQHMPPGFTASFAERLNRTLNIRTVEASHRMNLEPGTVYVAPGGLHMTVEKALGRKSLRLAIRQEPRDALFKPSVDVTFQSVLQHMPASKIVAVLLTGIGQDGAEGMVQIRRAGGTTIAEAESSAIVYGMPKAAAERGGAQYILPSYLIGQAILREVLKLGS